MKHPIDPKIDCVFKAVLGAEENRNLLVHFLNAVLGNELSAPICSVELLNPYNEREYLDDKLSIVDVKARDCADRLYQIEVQLLHYLHLPARMLYTWADIYSQQLQSGDHYDQLQPTYAIWLLGETILQQDEDYAHAFKFRDTKGRGLVEHGGIWLLELPKFSAQQIETEQQRWLKFFKDGERLDDTALPDWMTTQEMKQAMSTLRQFSEKERNYHAYQARQNFIREQQTILHELEAERQAKLAAELELQQAIDRERAAAERERAALAEVERLKALLTQRLD